MKKSIVLLSLSLTLILTSCSSDKNSNEINKTNKKPMTTITTDNKKKVAEDKKSSDNNCKPCKSKSEEEAQTGEGVNGKLLDISYDYDDLVNNPGGLYKLPNIYDSNYQEEMENWRALVLNQLKKISPKLSEDATDEEIENLYKKMLYIGGYDYMPLETIDRFSYVVFKDDAINPFTKENIIENMNVNVEIVLDASGSMAHVIDGQNMMDIAKTSILDVLNKMPNNAKVGLRVFGHKGDNTVNGKEESCASSELISPIEKLNTQKIKNALSPIKPTGWTAISDSIQKGSEDLKKFNNEKDLNILYIITDGIETCGGNPREAAKNLKDSNTNVVLGIIGFNVNASQNEVLKEIASAAGGYYSNAKDAANLTAELQKIHELAYSDYKWEPLTDEIIRNVSYNHQSSLAFQKNLITGIAERNAFNDMIYLASDGNENLAGLYKLGGKVDTKLRQLADERKDKVEKVLSNKYNEIVTESENYIKSLENRKGQTVAIIPMTSRINPSSEYFAGYGNKGGNIKQAENDKEKLNKEVNPDS